MREIGCVVDGDAREIDTCCAPSEPCCNNGCCCDSCVETEGKRPLEVNHFSGVVELVEPDDGGELFNVAKRIFDNNKRDIKQLLAVEDVHLCYFDGKDSKELTVPAGTRGGYVSGGLSVKNSWIDRYSVVFGVTIEDCYVRNSAILAKGNLVKSYLSSCRCFEYINLSVIESSVDSVKFEGCFCDINKSCLYDGLVSSSSVIKCTDISSFEITNSVVTVSPCVSNFNVDGAFIKECCKDFFQISNVGNARRTLSAYKTKRGGVRVSVGCFRGTLDELAIANAETHLGYFAASDGYLINNNVKASRSDEWSYTEYDMIIKYIRHHFKIDANTATIQTKD